MKFETKRQISRGIIFTLVGFLMLLFIVIWSDILRCDKKKKTEVVELLSKPDQNK